jgi:regulatory protein SWI5/metallothionein expression activator
MNFKGQKAYQCDWPGCNKTYSSRCYLKKHHDTHIDPNVFKCLHEGCDEAYVTSLELNQHFNKSHNGEKVCFENFFNHLN